MVKAGATPTPCHSFPLETFSELLKPLPLWGTSTQNPYGKPTFPPDPTAASFCTRHVPDFPEKHTYTALPLAQTGGGGPAFHGGKRLRVRQELGRQLLLRGGSHTSSGLSLKSRVALAGPQLNCPACPLLRACPGATGEPGAADHHPTRRPHMTQLLRYFVTDDSIFLHLEHVKGERTSGAPSASSGLQEIVLSHPLKIELITQPQAQPPEGEGRDQPAAGFSVMPGGRRRPRRTLTSWMNEGTYAGVPFVTISPSLGSFVF